MNRTERDSLKLCMWVWSLCCCCNHHIDTIRFETLFFFFFSLFFFSNSQLQNEHLLQWFSSLLFRCFYFVLFLLFRFMFDVRTFHNTQEKRTFVSLLRSYSVRIFFSCLFMRNSLLLCHYYELFMHGNASEYLFVLECRKTNWKCALICSVICFVSSFFLRHLSVFAILVCIFSIIFVSLFACFKWK